MVNSYAHYLAWANAHQDLVSWSPLMAGMFVLLCWAVGRLFLEWLGNRKDLPPTGGWICDKDKVPVDVLKRWLSKAVKK